MKYSSTTLALVGLALAACGSSSNEQCNLDTNMGCADGRVCERVRGGTQERMCFAPVLVRGRVFTATTAAAIAGARVVAIDANGAAASDVAVSAMDGTYSLRIPSERDASGVPTVPTHTLRADAADHQSFPGGIRPAIPVDTTTLVAGENDSRVVQNTTTEVGLFPLPAGQRGTISGTVQGDNHAGVLVVGGGATAISGRDGTYTLFNVTPGSVTVRGFAQNVQLNPAMATVTAAMSTQGVNLTPSTTPLATVSGSLQLVNAGGVSSTSVVLVVRETYNATLDRGEAPRGLRVGNISGAFQFTGVPDGEYAVLAAYENDGAVRDPDPGISGTDIVYVTVPAAGGRTITLPDSFKVTGALATVSPGRDAPEVVTTATPTFRWEDDSSEDGYEIRVYDVLGTVVWENLMLPSVSGGSEASVTYAGPALTAGLYYQFRVTSWRTRGGMRAPISRTEELRGVFYRPAM